MERLRYYMFMMINKLEKIFMPGKVRERENLLAQQSPVVILGRGKSGTRLIAWMVQYLGVELGFSPGQKSGDIEDRIFQRTIKQTAVTGLDCKSPADVSPADKELFRAAAYRIWKQAQVKNGPNTLWGWKWPETYVIIPLVLSVFPNARFIHTVRDGRDLAFKNHLTDDISKSLGRAILTRMNSENEPHYVQAAMSWKYQVDQYLDMKKYISKQGLLELVYEDICKSPAASLKKISKFLNMPVNDEAKEYSKTISVQTVAEYKNRPKEQIKEVEKLIKPTLKKVGYK